MSLTDKPTDNQLYKFLSPIFVTVIKCECGTKFPMTLGDDYQTWTYVWLSLATAKLFVSLSILAVVLLL